MTNARSRHHGDRGLILPVIMIILMLLAMLGAVFAFFTSAELGAAEARANRLQTRLAAEAGLERVKLLLREHRAEMGYWWNNPDLHDAQFWPPATEGQDFESHDRGSDQGGQSGFRGMTQTKSREVRWRYSLVAADLDKVHEEGVWPVRYGLTDECGKLNINWASRDQLMILFRNVLDPELPIEELVDCLIDWRDPDNTTSPAGAEADYYAQLTPPYAPANAPLKTVEELLMIKGFSARVVYGEDYNRNGILDAGEDDGLATFPPDNADGRLDLGLLPYVTIGWGVEHTMGWDKASDDRPKINLNGDPNFLSVALPQIVGSELAEYIVRARAGGVVFASPAQLAPGHENKIGQEKVPSPATPEDFLIVMDRFSTLPQPPNAVYALSWPLRYVVNVNTAPAPVLLACLGMDLDPEQIEQIVAARRQLGDKEKLSPAWLVNEGILTPEQLITYTGRDPSRLRVVTHSWQYTVESVGYGDHIGMMCRLQWIIDVQMQGQLVIVKYFRDISRLGPAWPIRAQEESRDIHTTSG